MMNGDRTCPSNKPYHDIGSGFNGSCFPWLEEALGSLGERYERLVRVVELVRVEEWLPYSRGWRGRPLKDGGALARAFLAKAVLERVPPPGGWWSG